MEGSAFDHLDTDTIRAKLEEFQRANEQLVKENDVFTAYRDRHVKPEDIEDAVDDDGSRGRKSKSKAKARPTTLTLDQKLDLATSELDATKRDTALKEAAAQRTLSMLEALLEQTELRIEEIKREAYEFKRDVVVGGADERTGKIMAERVVKYYEDKLRARDGSAEKLRLKNTALKAQLAKAEKGSKSKDDTGDVLHYIDFHQLQIENAQYLAKIEEKNAELLRLKLTTGNTVATLNTLKGKLSGLTKDITRLKNDIKARSQLLEKLRADSGELDGAVSKAATVREGLLATAREAARMPKVIDYVELVRAQQELEHEVQSWERKVEIALLAAKQRHVRSANASLWSGGPGGTSSASAREEYDAAATVGRTLSSSFFKTTFPGAGAGATSHAGASMGATLTGALARTAAAHNAELTAAADIAASAAVPGVSGMRAQGTWAGGAVPRNPHAALPRGVAGFAGAATRASGHGFGGSLKLGASLAASSRSNASGPAKGGAGAGAGAGAAAKR